MKYMVMECHPGYVVVMDEQGRFLKAANLNYEVGQTVDTIVNVKESQKHTVKWILSSVSVAACLCLMMLAAWQMMWKPYGSVRIQINPQVELAVNRLDDVVGLKALNADGEALIQGYNYKWKDMKLVSDELADRAVAMGFLSDGGTIHVLVDSIHAEWKNHAQEALQNELKMHMGDAIYIELDEILDELEDLIEEPDDDDDDEDDDGEDDDDDDDDD